MNSVIVQRLRLSITLSRTHPPLLYKFGWLLNPYINVYIKETQV